MYSYISENNFVPSNQIIVPTGYNVSGSTQGRQMSSAGLVTKNNRRCYFRLLAAKISVECEISGK